MQEGNWFVTVTINKLAMGLLKPAPTIFNICVILLTSQCNNLNSPKFYINIIYITVHYILWELVVSHLKWHAAQNHKPWVHLLITANFSFPLTSSYHKRCVLMYLTEILPSSPQQQFHDHYNVNIPSIIGRVWHRSTVSCLNRKQEIENWTLNLQLLMQLLIVIN